MPRRTHHDNREYGNDTLLTLS